MPSWKDKDYERFLKNDGWRMIPSKSGRDKWYEKHLEDGTFWTTRVSKSSSEIGTNLFASILTHQAHASKAYFNRVKNHKPKANWSRFEK